MNDLIKNSEELRKTAEEVLKETQVIESFSDLGKVVVIGSVRLNLVYRRDIDLLVIADTVDKDKAMKKTKEFLGKGIFRTVGLADYQTFPAFDMPEAFFFELIYPYKGEDWKFDTWYLRPEEDYTKLVLSTIEKFEPLLKQNPEKAALILKIKDAYFDGVKYKNKVKSIEIYRAVLEGGVTSVEEFDAYIQKR